MGEDLYKITSLDRATMIVDGEEIELSTEPTELVVEGGTINKQEISFNMNEPIKLHADYDGNIDDLLMGVDWSNSVDVTAKVVKQMRKVSNRRHKKKRINKKWAKKYGYHFEPVYKTVNASMIEIKAEDYPNDVRCSFELK